MAKRQLNKSAFVRSQPNHLSAAEVVAKARQAGLSIKASLVYTVRSQDAARKSGGAPEQASIAKKAEPVDLSAADFIRAQPKSKTAAQIAKAAARSGYSFKREYVYKVRGLEKKAKPKAVASLPRARSSKPEVGTAQAHAQPSASSKKQLHTLMMRIGLDAFETLYAEILREWRALAAGR